MNYLYHKNDVVEINNRKFNVEVLKTFDPDFEEPPTGWVRSYQQGRRHLLTNGRNQVGCDFPWNQGDKYIKSVPELILVERQIALDNESNN
tara:strand:- start:138 stop:410 length:273 start_codon:yes stop_codon:yes gene_type:complete